VADKMGRECGVVEEFSEYGSVDGQLPEVVTWHAQRAVEVEGVASLGFLHPTIFQYRCSLINDIDRGLTSAASDNFVVSRTTKLVMGATRCVFVNEYANVRHGPRP
jgi:hypothetical protein